MVEMKLTNGLVTFLDDDDFEIFRRWKYRYSPHHNGSGYATRCKRVSPKKNITVYLHREILGVWEKGLQVDHINGDKLDNRKSNLRICTGVSNSYNRKKNSNSTHKYKGVYKQTWENGECRWYARIGRGKNSIPGGHATEEEAARAYDREAKKKYGQFAKLNFPNE